MINLKFKFNFVNFSREDKGVDKSLISKTYVLLISISNSVKLSKLLIEFDKSSI